jgi:hypothetical protein
MNTASEILVIIVSVILSLFLIALIVLAVYAIRLVKELREVVARAEKVITSAESIGKIFNKSVGPVSVFNFARSVMESVAEHKHKGGK